MSATNQQMFELSLGLTFQKKAGASIMKKAVAICDDARVNGTANYTANQRILAAALGTNQRGYTPYYLPLACSTNVIASNISVSNGETLSDISDAALDAQVYTTVFQDLL